MRTLARRTLLWPAAVIGSAILGLLGAPPILVTIAAAATWWKPLVSRFGYPGASALVAVSWVWSTFFSATIAIALPGGVSSTAVITHAVVGLVGAAHRRRAKADAQGNGRPSQSTPLSMLVCALVGPTVWMATWALSACGVGSGLGWSIYSDSTRDMWFIRQNLIAGGLPFAGELSLWPVEHTITTAQLSVKESFGTSPAHVEAQLNAHAFGWSLLIAASCLLAGVLVGSIALRLTGSVLLTRFACAAASLVVLWMPITGFALRVGQLNVHMILVLALASLTVQFDARFLPWMKAAFHLFVAVLLLLVWMPFAAVPAVFVALEGWRAARNGSLRRPVPLATVGAGAVAAAFYVSNFLLPALEPVTASAAEASKGPLSIESSNPNPTSPVLALALALALAACVALLLRKDRDLAISLAITLLTLVSVTCAYALMRGGLRVGDEYYAAKLVSIAMVIVGLTLLGPLFSLARLGGFASWAAAAVVGILAVLVAVTPVQRDAEPWAFTPWQALVASTYGPAASTSDRIIEFSSDAELALAWRLEPPYDTPVNLMQSSLERTTTNMWGTPLRSQVRGNLGDTSVEQLCKIAESTDLPLAVYSRDTDLAREVSDTCPLAHIRVSVVP